MADPAKADRGGEKRDRVYGNRYGCGERPHEHAAECWTAGFSDRHARSEFAVRLNEVCPVDQARKVGLISDLEHHRARSQRERDHQQVPQAQHLEHGEQRNQAEENGSCGVRGHEDGPLAPAVDPYARMKPEQEEGDRQRGTEQTHLARGSIEGVHGEQRQRQHRDLRADRRDAFPEPQPGEVRVATQQPQPAPSLRAALVRRGDHCR